MLDWIEKTTHKQYKLGSKPAVAQYMPQDSQNLVRGAVSYPKAPCGLVVSTLSNPSQ
jgi:hypothetical protein